MLDGNGGRVRVNFWDTGQEKDRYPDNRSKVEYD